MTQEEKVRKFAWTLASLQATMQDVERRILMAAHDGGMAPEILQDCQQKLTSAAKDFDRIPEKL